MRQAECYAIHCSREDREACLAFLGQWPFYAFEEDERGWLAYVFSEDKGEDFDDSLRVALRERAWVLREAARLLPAENWNARWEENFQPVRVGDFCGIRAAFHPPFAPPVRHDLIIQPKMAFGTGHHETTFMMVDLMRDLPFSGSTVFDYGCGTGILGILALRMGAYRVLAIDVEEEACVNTRENALRNGVAASLEVKNGDLSVLGQACEKSFDFILANINRGVILASLPQMKDLLKPEGRLLISGFLQEDEALMREKLDEHAFHLRSRKQKGNWLAFSCGL